MPKGQTMQAIAYSKLRRFKALLCKDGTEEIQICLADALNFQLESHPLAAVPVASMAFLGVIGE